MTYNTINDAMTMQPGGGAALGHIDQYALVRELGGGGFGTVYLAKDTVSGIEVAVKGLPPLVRNNREELENVRSNFALVSRLSHTNIAKALVLHPVKEVSYASEDVRQKLRVLSGDFLMVMEYAPGVTLSQWRRQFAGNKVPLEQALDIVRQVASAIDYAHERRIVHRDIKPANVMMETAADGRTVVRILDFGLAAEIRSSMGRVSQEIHDTSGTRPYMAPEQWLGGKQGPATDQYALAVMFCELLTGEVPFASVFDTGDPVMMMNVVGREPYAPPAELPKPVRLALAKALAKKPEERFASCVEFVAALEGKVKVSRRGAETRIGGSGIWKALGVLALLAALGGGLWWTVNEKGMKGTTETAVATNTTSVSSVVPSVPSVPSVSVVSVPQQPTNDSSRAAAEVASRQAKEANARERAAEFIRLKTRISIKRADAKHKMDAITGFREDQEGLEEHIKSADSEWKTLFALPAPETLEEARAAFEIADKAEAQIALDLDWLTKNKAGRDAAKAAKSEIAALLAGDIATFKAEKYAADAFREGGKLREAAEAAFKKGDFGESGRLMAEARGRFADAVREAKVFVVKMTLASAQEYLDASHWQNCIAECDKVLKWEPANAEAKRLKAIAEFRQPQNEIPSPWWARATEGDIANFICLTWAPVKNAKSYEILRSTGSSASNDDVIVVPSRRQCFYCDYDTKKDGGYSYRICAITDEGRLVSKPVKGSLCTREDLFTLHYDPNGGQGEMPDELRWKESNRDLTRNRFVRDGYAFMGWAKTPSGNVQYHDEDSVMTDGASMRIYAVWRKADENGFVMENGKIIGWAERGNSDVKIPEGTREIGSHAFRSSNITSVLCPLGLERIGYDAFMDCRSLTNVTVWADIKKFDAQAFCGCQNLSGIAEVPNCFTRLTGFKGSGFSEIVLPSSLSALHRQDFYAMRNLRKVWFRGNAPALPDDVKLGNDSKHWYTVSPYCGTSKELVSFVPQGSTGWKDATDAIPDMWPTYEPRAIRRYAGSPPKGNSLVVLHKKDQASSAGLAKAAASIKAVVREKVPANGRVRRVMPSEDFAAVLKSVDDSTTIELSEGVYDIRVAELVVEKNLCIRGKGIGRTILKCERVILVGRLVVENLTIEKTYREVDLHYYALIVANESSAWINSVEIRNGGLVIGRNASCLVASSLVKGRFRRALGNLGDNGRLVVMNTKIDFDEVMANRDSVSCAGDNGVTIMEGCEIGANSNPDEGVRIETRHKLYMNKCRFSNCKDQAICVFLARRKGPVSVLANNLQIQNSKQTFWHYADNGSGTMGFFNCKSDTKEARDSVGGAGAFKVFDSASFLELPSDWIQ